jgi:hypothetical protein
MSKKSKKMKYQKLMTSDLNSFVSLRDWCYENINSFKKRKYLKGQEKISIYEARKILEFIESSLVGDTGKEYLDLIKKLKKRLDIYEKKDDKKFVP